MVDICPIWMDCHISTIARIIWHILVQNQQSAIPVIRINRPEATVMISGIAKR
jgi:hypothetical protein